MQNFALIELGGFLIAIMLLVLNQFRISLQQLPEERTLRKIMTTLIILIALDVIAGIEIPGHRIITPEAKFVLGLINCSAAIFIPYLWNLFIHYKIYGSAYYFRKYFVPITLPLVMGILFCITRSYKLSLGYSTLTTTDVWYITNIISIFYLIMASTISFRSACKNFTKTGRRVEMYYCWIMVIPIIAIIMQTILIRNWFPIVCPVFVLVFLHIYVSQQNMLITLDYLTGINNERRLNTYLRDKTADLTSGQRLFLVIATLDNINHIRRKFGKSKVDEILVAFAEFLRTMMPNDNTFLAHHRKYSFAIVLEKKSWEETEAFCNALITNSTTSPLQQIISWPITFSINFSEFGRPGVNNVIDLLDDTQNHCFKPATALNANGTAETNSEQK